MWLLTCAYYDFLRDAVFCREAPVVSLPQSLQSLHEPCDDGSALPTRTHRARWKDLCRPRCRLCSEAASHLLAVAASLHLHLQHQQHYHNATITTAHLIVGVNSYALDAAQRHCFMPLKSSLRPRHAVPFTNQFCDYSTSSFVLVKVLADLVFISEQNARLIAFWHYPLIPSLEQAMRSKQPFQCLS